MSGFVEITNTEVWVRAEVLRDACEFLADQLGNTGCPVRYWHVAPEDWVSPVDPSTCADCAEIGCDLAKKSGGRCWLALAWEQSGGAREDFEEVFPR